MSEEFKVVGDDYIKLAQEGHHVWGTLTDVSEFVGEYGPTNKYEFTAEKGQGFNGDDQVFDLAAGDQSSFLGHFSIDKGMKRIKVGQRFRVTRLANKTNAKGKDYKDHEVQAGPMDASFTPVNIPVADSEVKQEPDIPFEG